MPYSWSTDELTVPKKIGIGTENPQQALDVKGAIVATGEVKAKDFKTASSMTLKENIRDLSLEEALDALAQLNPVSFNYKTDEPKETHLGFIAEDVPDLVASIDRKGVSAMDLVALLTKVVQQQQKEINNLKQQKR